MATVDSSYRSSSNSPASFQLAGDNSSSTAQTTVNAAINAASSRDRCRRCNQLVYLTERIGPVKESLYHKSCFKCLKCDRQLDFKTYFTNSIDLADKEIYCQSHVPRSGKGVFSTENIHIQNVMKAPKLNVMQKLDDRLKVCTFDWPLVSFLHFGSFFQTSHIDSQSVSIAHAMKAQQMLQQGREKISANHKFPVIPMVKTTHRRSHLIDAFY